VKSQLFFGFFGFFGFLGFFTGGGVGVGVGVGGGVGVGVGEVAGPPNSLISAVAIGDPSPVQASHPGPAENAPLFPEVMSLKQEAAAFAA
jgi:hypothetical protein